MAEDLKRRFVEIIKAACERYLADGEHGVLGHSNNCEIEGIEIVPEKDVEPEEYSYSLRRDDGTYETVTKEVRPVYFVVKYWDEFATEGSCHTTKTLGLVEVLDEVGRLIAGQSDIRTELDRFKEERK